MNKQILNKIILLFLLLVTILSPLKAVYATEAIQGGESFIEEGENAGNPISDVAIKSVSDKIYNILFNIAVVVAVIVAAILGIEFMLGSTSDKAKIQESAIPFIVGCVVIFGGFGIWKIIATAFSNV